MSYLGRGLEQVDNISKLDNITFNGGTTYALTKDSAAFTPISSNALLVSIDGVIQQGNFSVSGTNIVFNFSPTGSNTCDFIMHYGTGVAFTPADSSITKDKTDFISTSSSSGLQIKGDGTTDGTLQLNCSQNSHGVKIKSPAHSAGQSYTLTLPATAPATDKMLQTNSSGVLSFVDAPSGDIVKIASASDYSTGVAKLNIDHFSTTYKFYKFYATLRHEVGNTDLRFRWRTSGSEQQGSYYIYTGLRGQINYGGTTEREIHFSGFYTNYAKVSNTSTASNNHDTLIDWTFYDPMKVVLNRPYVLGNTQYYRDDDIFRQNTFGAKYNTASISYNGFALWAGSGNIEDYQWTLYGVKS